MFTGPFIIYRPLLFERAHGYGRLSCRYFSILQVQDKSEVSSIPKSLIASPLRTKLLFWGNSYKLPAPSLLHRYHSISCFRCLVHTGVSSTKALTWRR